jgi:hypothetical protein
LSKLGVVLTVLARSPWRKVRGNRRNASLETDPGRSIPACVAAPLLDKAARDEQLEYSIISTCTSPGAYVAMSILKYLSGPDAPVPRCLSFK